jgi:hypothetical protein
LILFQILWEISKDWGNFEDQTGEKKRLVWLGKQPIFGLFKEVFFGPAITHSLQVKDLIVYICIYFKLIQWTCSTQTILLKLFLWILFS